MALSIKLNKTTFTPGETMTLTVTTGAGERDHDVPIVVRVSVEGVGEGTASGKIDRPDAPITVVDDSGRIWTAKTDDGTTATFTATA